MENYIFDFTPSLLESEIPLAGSNFVARDVKCISGGKASSESPLVSIITVVFNGENSINRTINSVLGQSYVNIEYIIIDGGSTDNTVCRIKQYLDKISFFTSERDRGIADGMNKGIIASRGDLLCFLNSGDYFVDDQIIGRIVNSYLSENWIWAYGQAKLLLDFKETRFSQTPKKYKSWKNYFMTQNCHQATFFRRKMFEMLGLYSIGNDRYFDIDFFIRAANISKPYELNMPIVWYDITGVSSVISLSALKNRIRLTFYYCNLLHSPLWITLICIRWIKSFAGHFVKKILRLTL
jgi:glycosyltransferase involved in cell wall biosynthesis